MAYLMEQVIEIYNLLVRSGRIEFALQIRQGGRCPALRAPRDIFETKAGGGSERAD
jgi:hypothetical protein